MELSWIQIANTQCVVPFPNNYALQVVLWASINVYIRVNTGTVGLNTTSETNTVAYGSGFIAGAELVWSAV